MDNTMITIPQVHVCIPLEMYDDMMMDMDSLMMIKSVLFQNCSLDYGQKHLRFDGEAVSMVLKLIDHKRYRETLRIKKKEAEADD